MPSKIKKKILVVVAHPDDETIGMGGTIKFHKLKGDVVYAISMTDGVNSRVNHNKKNIEERKKASFRSSKILGYEWVAQENLNDNSLDDYKLIERILCESESDLIFPDFRKFGRSAKIESILASF